MEANSGKYSYWNIHDIIFLPYNINLLPKHVDKRIKIICISTKSANFNQKTKIKAVIYIEANTGKYGYWNIHDIIFLPYNVNLLPKHMGKRIKIIYISTKSAIFNYF